MSIIAQATTGKIKKAHLTIIYGTSGVGKSTFGADSPKPFFISSEKGTSNLDVTRVSPKTFEEVVQVIKELTTEKHDFKSLVIDSLDWLEPLVFNKVVRETKKSEVLNIEDIGYAKGYIYALDYWREIMIALTELQEKRNMNVILIAHSEVKTFQDPLVQGGYDRIQMKMHHKGTALWTEYVDCVLFATYELSTKKDESKRVRAFADGTRVLYTETRAGFHAKNRFGLPFELPLSWESYDEAVNGSSGKESESAIVSDIKELVKSIKDEKVLNRVQVNLKNNPPIEQLLKMRNHLQTMVAS